MKTIYISAHAGAPLIDFLQQNGYSLHLLDGADSPVSDPVSSHADIHMCQMGLWDHDHIRIFPGNPNELGMRYPADCRFNAICTEQYLIHNFRHTSPALQQSVTRWQNNHLHLPLREINVKQGYCRCTCLPVTDSSFVTSDPGIARALETADADVLRIRPGHILLPGCNYGFLGGCAGHLILDGKRTILFNGDLSAHPDYEKIAAFLKDRDIHIKYFPEFPLTDIGSILTGTPFMSSMPD